MNSLKFKIPPAFASLSELGFWLKQQNEIASSGIGAGDHAKTFSLLKCAMKHLLNDETPLELKLMCGCIEGDGNSNENAVLLVSTLIALSLLSHKNGRPTSYILQVASMGVTSKMLEMRLLLAEFQMAGFVEIDFCDQISLNKSLLSRVMNLPHWLKLDASNDSKANCHPFVDDD